MASCCAEKSELVSEKDDCAPTSSPATKPQGGILDLLSPILSALLHSSCCWLPLVVDFFSVGSASVASVQQLRPFFLLVTVLLLVDSFRRGGLTKRNLGRAAFSVGILAFPSILAWGKARGGREVLEHGSGGGMMSDARLKHGSCH